MSFNIVAENGENTVVTEYKPETRHSDAYQSEADLEKAFIKDLEGLGYEYLQIHTEKELLKNLRKKISELNGYDFSDAEWQRLYDGCISAKNEGIKEKTRRLQTEDVHYNLTGDDGRTRNIKLIDKRDIHNNKLQVINQYEEKGGVHETRYDVTILVNGLPLVHVELKRRGVPIREAFNQIIRYGKDSFWAGCALYEYVQIFVISNGIDTKYYSNTTRDNHVKNETGGKATHSSNSFEFTSFWADANNRIIPDLVDFTRTFFCKHTILNILTKYCVFTSEDMLLVMRPYQIVATERILNRIEIANNYNKFSKPDAGGYVWHTTGSGKTLTSFKTAQLATRLPYIDKVLFVVDRKDLDYQTMREYDRFEKGAANSNRSTEILKRQLESNDADKKIIITTIQKLSTYVKKYPDAKSVYDKHFVIIFDECHRSQFGEMHALISSHFKKYHMFGFTGTPIFAANANTSVHPAKGMETRGILMTTAQTFGDKLHTYTIVDAINDGNVLPFRIDYIKTMQENEGIEDEEVTGIDKEGAYMAPKRISLVVKYILDSFATKTGKNEAIYRFTKVTNVADVVKAGGKKESESHSETHLNGFNSIFAVSSIEAAKAYYNEFKRQMKDLPSEKQLKVALIYSFAPNEPENDGAMAEEDSDSTEGLDKSSRDFLDGAIKDYNEYFQVEYDTSSEKFPNYYKDVSLRMKNREIDLLIVVDMFLTGFDSTTLNTLWVDKNLKMHGLIQAFSRTNRILNSVKPYGNIVCFRPLQKQTEEAIALFGDKDAESIVLVRSFKDYYEGYRDKKGAVKGYEELVKELKRDFPIYRWTPTGEENSRDFVKLFSSVLRLYNILSAFDEFKGREILSEQDMQNYTGRYYDIKDHFIGAGHSGTPAANINDDIVFEIEIAKRLEVNVDYILMLVEKYHKTNCEDKEILTTIRTAIDASMNLRSKKKLIEDFIAKINTDADVMEEWSKYVSEQKKIQLDEIIIGEGLKPEETRKFMDNCLKSGDFRTDGSGIDKIMPPVSYFSGERTEIKNRVTDKLREYYNRFFGLRGVAD